jgi:putative ABC transport system substrate-binding protein
MKRRKLLIALGAGLATPLASFAQQQDKIRRIGALAFRSRSTPSNPEVFYDSFMRGMRDLGYVEGKNIAIEWRFADGQFDRVPGLAAELVKMNVEAVVTHSTQATRVLQQATRKVPIVTAVIDPVGDGFAASLARPGGNVTGLSIIAIDVSPKQIEFLKALVPGNSRIAFLKNPDNPAMAGILNNIQGIARTAGVSIVPVDARTPVDIERGFAKMTQEKIGSVIVTPDAYFMAQRQQIAALAAGSRIATMFSFRELVMAGGLVSYGQDLSYAYHRIATYVDKILKGAKPGELPIEQPTKFHLAINRKTAKALGLTIPQELLLRADEVIE